MNDPTEENIKDSEVEVFKICEASYEREKSVVNNLIRTVIKI